MSKVGLNADLVASLQGSVDSQLSILDAAQNTVQSAGFVAANPLSIVISPGSRILSPTSVPQILLASAEISAARGSAAELLRKLGSEIVAQQFASSAEGISYSTGFGSPTQDNDRVSPTVDESDPFNPLNFLKDVAENISTVFGWGDYVYSALEAGIPEKMTQFTEWWDTLPPWAKGLRKVARALPFLGTALSLNDFVTAWVEEDTRGKWQHGGSLAFDVIGYIPNPYVALGSAVAGYLWDTSFERYSDLEYTQKHPEKVFSHYQKEPWTLVVNVVVPITIPIWGPYAR